MEAGLSPGSRPGLRSLEDRPEMLPLPTPYCILGHLPALALIVVCGNDLLILCLPI